MLVEPSWVVRRVVADDFAHSTRLARVSGRTLLCALRHTHAIGHAIAWMQNNAIARGKSSFDLGNPAVPVPDLDHLRPRPAVRDGEGGPLVALPEQRGDWNGRRA